MQNKNLPYTLGLDIGMASVGAALLLPDQQRILALHVRTFDKAETAKEGESLNKIRRDSRLTRRRIRRRAFRLLRLARLMKRVGLIETPHPDAFAVADATPWQLRAEGLDRRLQDNEWAAVLYHIIKHRGFQSNRKSEAKADEKAGQMLSGVGRNKALLAEGGYRTIGELAANHADFVEAKRNKGSNYSHTFARADLAAELKLLFERQRSVGNTFASADFEAAVHDLLMARKPTLSGENLLKMIGKCTFEKAEYRAPKASYRAERFVWLGKLNNLKIVGSGDARSLTESERRIIIELPFTQAKLTYKQVRKALGLAAHERFNLVSYRFDPKGKDPEDVTLFEAKAFHTLRKAYESANLKNEWQRDAINADRLDVLSYALSVFKDDSESRQWLTAQGIEAAIIETVLHESFDKFIHLSQKALKIILPFMEQGQRYDEAAKSAGYDHSQTDTAVIKQSYLPAPDKELIRNPVVYRALNQARKLVNAIVREYGPPAAIHIELARDLSKSFDERKRIERGQKEYREEKEKTAQRFIEDVGREPKRDELLKMRLYHEQDSQCPYCQSPLDYNRMFDQSDVYAQVDHALPYSRSFDDSMNNKVVVHTKCNQDKGNRTPYEHFDGASDSLRWQRFVAWVQINKAIRQAKRNRLLRVNFGAEEANEFRERNLNDTRYICREFKRMIETGLHWHQESTENNRCVVLSGQLTSLLRARWGLIKIREEGDLHHALDAAVIAAASRSLVKRMSDYSRRNELEMVRGNYIDPATGEIVDIAAIRQLEDHFPEPWPYFRKELLAHLSNDPPSRLGELPGYEGADEVKPIRVSRAPIRRGLGSAHQETIRSIREGSQSAIKTPLTALTLKDLENIVGFERDTALIAAIRERLEAFGGDGKKAFDAKQPPLRKPSKDPAKAPIIRSVKLLVVQKSGIPIRGGIANNGAMLRADIFTKGGKFYAVPIYVADAVKAELPNRAVVAYVAEEAWPVMDESYQFLFSLNPNDWVTVKLKDEMKEGYFSGLDRATGAISLWLHDRKQSVGKDGQWRGIGIKTALSVEKYHVDLLGNLYRVHKEDRQPIYAKRRKG